MKTIEVEFIHTFNNLPQQTSGCDVSEISANRILRTKQSMFEFATEYLSEEQKQELVKISICVNPGECEIDPPDWFLSCNGKLWIENGQLQED